MDNSIHFDWQIDVQKDRLKFEAENVSIEVRVEPTTFIFMSNALTFDLLGPDIFIPFFKKHMRNISVTHFAPASVININTLLMKRFWWRPSFDIYVCTIHINKYDLILFQDIQPNSASLRIYGKWQQSCHDEGHHVEPTDGPRGPTDERLRIHHGGILSQNTTICSSNPNGSIYKFLDDKWHWYHSGHGWTASHNELDRLGAGVWGRPEGPRASLWWTGL